MGFLMKKSHNIEQDINKTGKIFAYAGAVILFIMMIIGSIDVIGRYLFNSSISGAMEINKNLMAGVVIFSWVYTQANRAHARVGFIVESFSQSIRIITIMIGDALSFLFFSLIAWQSFTTGILTWKEHRYIQIINFPVAVMYFAISLGAFVTCLLIIFQLKSSINYFRRANKEVASKPDEMKGHE